MSGLPAHGDAPGDATLPHDHPRPGRPHRVYAALTNHCNRACPWCSTCSSPAGGTFLALQACARALPASGTFELQLEGGEPTVHPDFWRFVALAHSEPRCTRLVLCTNGVAIPRAPARRRAWIVRLGEPVTVKLSVNHHLLEHDRGLLALARGLVDDAAAAGGDRSVVINVRLRRGAADDDAAVVEAVRDAGLLPHANVFHLQRYGYASDQSGWDEPFLVGHDFRMVNPDGAVFGPDLVARSEAMRALP